MAIFWFVAGLFVGYLAVSFAASEYVYSVLKYYGFVWMSIYGAIKISEFLVLFLLYLMKIKSF
ncbi:hypothetical protein [Francisella orientalis]|nr:hypothetical protein [Francisella orientalis]AFJ42750.1 NADH dehydrogenase subunit 6 [Francisella orientalis str. Toba 04]